MTCPICGKEVRFYQKKVKSLDRVQTAHKKCKIEGFHNEREMECPIKGCSEDCKLCNGDSTTWKEDGEVKECVFVTVWKARKKPTKSSPYVGLGVKK